MSTMFVNGKPVPKTSHVAMISPGDVVDFWGAMRHNAADKCPLTTDFYSFEVRSWPCSNRAAPGYIKSAPVALHNDIPTPVFYSFSVPKDCIPRHGATARQLEVYLTHGGNPLEAVMFTHYVK